MDTEGKKLELIQWLAALQDLKILRQIESLKLKQEQEDLTTAGTPMTQKMLSERIKSARERINRGEYSTMEELEQEMQDW